MLRRHSPALGPTWMSPPRDSFALSAGGKLPPTLFFNEKLNAVIIGIHFSKVSKLSTSDGSG